MTGSIPPVLNTAPTQWDLKRFYNGPDDPAIEEDRRAIEQCVLVFEEQWRPDTGWHLRPEDLARALEEYCALVEQGLPGGKPALYLYYLTQLDQRSAAARTRLEEVSEWAVDLSTRLQFFELRLASLPEDRWSSDPQLQPWRHYLDRQFQAARHQLSEPVERVTRKKRRTARTMWVEMMQDLRARERCQILLDDGRTETVPFSRVRGLLQSPRSEVRQAAFAAWGDVTARHLLVATHSLNAVLADYSLEAELRGFARPDEQRYLEGDLDAQAVDVMAEAVRSRFDIVHDLYRLKAALTGNTVLPYWDRDAPYGSLGRGCSYEDAIVLVHRVFQRLLPEFGEIAAAFTHGRIDSLPKEGKVIGGYFHPGLYRGESRVLLNWSGTFQDLVSLLAHELGHGVHDHLAKRYQNGLQWDPSLVLSEIGSTFFEEWVRQEAQAAADPETRFAIELSRADSEANTVVRQVAAHLFERDLHAQFQADHYLGAEEISQLFLSHMTAYMGTAVEQSAGAERLWVTWPSFWNPFYVFSYAMSLLVSMALQELVRQEPTNIGMFRELLAAGSSDSPRRLLKRIAGIDISQPDVWLSGLRQMRHHVDCAWQMARDLGKVTREAQDGSHST